MQGEKNRSPALSPVYEDHGLTAMMLFVPSSWPFSKHRIPPSHHQLYLYISWILLESRNINGILSPEASSRAV